MKERNHRGARQGSPSPRPFANRRGWRRPFDRRRGDCGRSWTSRAHGWQRNHVSSGRPGGGSLALAMAIPVATNRINPQSFREGRRSAFNGLCMAMVQTLKQPGTIHVHANSVALASASIAIAANSAKWRPAVKGSWSGTWDKGQAVLRPYQVCPRGYLRAYFFTSMVNSAPYRVPAASAAMPSGPVESAAAG